MRMCKAEILQRVDIPNSIIWFHLKVVFFSRNTALKDLFRLLESRFHMYNKL